MRRSAGSTKPLKPVPASKAPKAPTPKLTHLDSRGRARMVDVTDKDTTVRTALATGSVRMKPATIERLGSGTLPKGDALAVARVAGIMAAKRTPELIPLCHPLRLTSVEVDLTLDTKSSKVRISARVRCAERTGVEMEALTAVSGAALAIYDMCKAVDKDMVIEDISVQEKTGGKSGDYRRKG